MTELEAAKLVHMLFKSFPSSRVDPDHAKAYESALCDLDASVAAEAVGRLRATRTFLPAISEIRSAAADVTLGPMRSGEEAYGVLLRAVRACGWPSPPRFRDPHIAKAMSVWGSWADLCASPTDDPGGRARFIELYEEGAKQERQDVIAGKPLPAPRSGGREFGVPKERVRPEAMQLVHSVPMGPPAPRAKPAPSPYAGKRLTAAELDAALEVSK